MPERFCTCGERLGGMNRSEFCFKCRQRNEAQKQEQAKAEARAKRIAEAKANGKVLVHTCLATKFDPYVPGCTCRKFVSFDEAEDMVYSGQAVDLAERAAVFAHREILLIGVKVKVPRAQTIERTHIERAITDSSKPTHQQQTDDWVAALKRRVEQDALDKHEEERVRWDEYARITKEEFFSTQPRQKRLPNGKRQTLAPLIVPVDADEFDRDQSESWGRPGVFHIQEERTSVGTTVISPREESAWDDPEAIVAEQVGDDEPAEPTDEDQPQPESRLDTELKPEPEDDVDVESPQEEAEEFEEAA